MLSFIVIVCNAKKDVIESTSSSLTWFEEWFFYFEFVWGRTLLRWQDAASQKEYDISPTALHAIFRKKLEIINLCRKSWPKYARYNEDFDLMKGKWRERYKGVRLVMWDNTNITMQFKPGDPQLQRITYSSYYSENCAEGVFFFATMWMDGCAQSLDRSCK